MFKYYEIYTVTVSEEYDENDLQGIADDYKEYVEKRQKRYSNYEEDIDTFSDYAILELHFEKSLHHLDYDFEDSNIKELYEEIKKYM